MTNYKKSGDSFIVTYDKYIINDPYKILNYYIGLDNAKAAEDKVLNYLKGSGKKEDILSVLTKKDINKIKSKKSEIKVTYKLYKNNLVIDSIE